MNEAIDNTDNQLILVGLRIDPDSFDPNLYTLVIYGDQDPPIRRDGYILWFTSPAKIQAAVDQCDDDLSRFELPTELEFVYDLAATLYLIQSEERDESAVILNCLNFLLDMLRVTVVTPSTENYQVLSDFADHTTFDKDIAGFFVSRGMDRGRVINAILWAVGAITVKSVVI